jgi:type VI secretion system protein ImpJ
MRLPEIEATLNARSAHPLDLYCKLAGMAGALASLQPGNGVPIFPAFDYTELLVSFEPLIKWIDAALATIRQGYRVHQFTAEPGGFWIDPPATTGPSMPREFVIGLRMPAQAGESDAGAWLEQTVIASRDHLPALARQRMRGLPRRHLLREERAVYSVGDDTAMFALTLDDAWFDPLQTLHIDARAGVRGLGPWAVQFFTADSDVTSAVGQSGRSDDA